MATRIQVLIVDRDIMWRDALRSALADLPDISVCGVSPTGKLGLNRARQFNPDIVVLDSGLTDLDAASFTQTLHDESPETGIILASDSTPQSAEVAIQALGEGAFDFVLKPQSAVDKAAPDALRRTLVPKIRSFSIRRYSRIATGTRVPTTEGRKLNIRPLGVPGADDIEPAVPKKAGPPAVDKIKTATLLKIVRESRETDLQAVLIGVSTGGPEALRVVLSGFPAQFPLPIITVLHMPKLFTARMAASLDRHTPVLVKEAEDGEIARPGVAYLAQGGKHLLLDKATRRRIALRIGGGPAVNGCRPSVDVLFRSAADVLRGKALAVLLTGMGDDGVRGLRELKAFNAPVLAQDEESSVVWGMPGSAVHAGLVDAVVPLRKMAHRIVALVRGDNA